MTPCARIVLPLLGSATIMLATGAVTRVEAQTATATSEVVQGSQEGKRLAARLAQQALVDYRAGRYEQAARAYEHAYEGFASASLLFNLGQCYRRMGEIDVAIAIFERYLRLEPDAPERASIEGWIAQQRGANAVSGAVEPPSGRALVRHAQPESESASTTVVVPASLAPASSALSLSESRSFDDRRDEPPPARAQRHPVAVVDAARQRRPAGRGADGEGPALYERWWFWTAVTAVTVAGIATALLVDDGDGARRGPKAGTLGVVQWD